MTDTPAPCCTPGPGDRAEDGLLQIGQPPVQPPVQRSPKARPRRGQVLIPAGSFVMGDHSGDGYDADGELPLHEVSLSAYWIDETAVTNSAFAAFVKDTGYRTLAERDGVSAVFHLAKPDRRHVVGAPPATPWWLTVKGACWRAPEGPGSGIGERPNHPVVHVAHEDALAFATWSGRRLPTEAEWEYAARGGLAGARYPWGDELTPGGRHRANIWQGEFPVANTLDDGFLTTAPVKTFRPNGYGLFQTAGNVWEWCADWFDAGYYAVSPPADPHGPETGSTRVMRGGSYLCHASYCHRYRVSARSQTPPDSTAANLGFRCASDA